LSAVTRGEGVSRSDPLEYHVCLSQQGLGSRGVAGGRSAVAQAGQRGGLAPGTADRAGQFQGLLVTRLSLTTPVAEVAVDRLLQVPGRA
jgi:hypothetical protein